MLCQSQVTTRPIPWSKIVGIWYTNKGVPKGKFVRMIFLFSGVKMYESLRNLPLKPPKMRISSLLMAIVPAP